MKILLTGASGYIGKQLLPTLLNQGHFVVCCVRNKKKYLSEHAQNPSVQILECDLLKKESLEHIPRDIDAAYYLVHSMSASQNYSQLESQSAINFRMALENTEVKQVIYLGGISNDKTLSDHLASRKKVEFELQQGRYHFTAFRAGIIVGSGSASFEIIRDLVEKLPVMVAPRWLNTRCQPIAINDVILFLSKALANKDIYDNNFDIGGPDILTYKSMLQGYATVRRLKRKIFVVPVMTPRLSSYWLYFITSTSYKLAMALVDSMKIEVVCRTSNIKQALDVSPMGYHAALQSSFTFVEDRKQFNQWKQNSDKFKELTSLLTVVPKEGCFKDEREVPIQDRASTLEKIWKIGGKTGWYYANALWKLRGLLDKWVGGKGMNSKSSQRLDLVAGDTIDFWRVLSADRKEGRLLLYAEMKLPGNAWLEFKINNNRLLQTATFRPRGLMGRLYWYSVLPFHDFIFSGLAKHLAK